ncbi:MAG: hypothetical protein ACO3JL_19920, partial [Myxococcota bacterium]
MNTRARFFICALSALALAGACDCGGSATPTASPLGDGFAALEAVSTTSLKLTFSRSVNAASAKEASYEVHNFASVPAESVEVKSAALTSDTLVEITTAPMRPGQAYTLTVAGLLDSEGYEIAGTLNFVVPSAGVRVSVEIQVADVETARRYDELTLLATVDPQTGAFSERLEPYPLLDNGSVFLASIDVVVDPNRTLDQADDGDPAVDRRPYAV